MPMTTRRTDVGREVQTALGEVLAHVRGATQANEAPDPETVTRKRTPIPRRGGRCGQPPDSLSATSSLKWRTT